ncbi:MAG: Crp/Fnr family transcriptional regulator [Clostridia bacterium]|nr:Crp/Fnr family transcriptional regulator [Clostridia bacterium]
MNYKEIPLFKGIPEGFCERIVKDLNAAERSYVSGQEICDYADCGDFVGVVTEGEAFVERIDVNGYRTILERVRKGEIFGKAMAYASGEDCVSAVCYKNCKVLFFDSGRISAYAEGDFHYRNEMLANIISLFFNKTAYLSDRVEVISHRNTREKLMRYFRLLAGDGETALLPFSFSQLADYICADRSAMMRELKCMKEDGLISVEKRRITILGDTV